jgi:hypothetical protein
VGLNRLPLLLLKNNAAHMLNIMLDVFVYDQLHAMAVFTFGERQPFVLRKLKEDSVISAWV